MGFFLGGGGVGDKKPQFSLIRLSSSICSFLDADGDFFSPSCRGDGSKYLATCSCDDYKSNKLGIQEDCKGTLESIWKKTSDLCQSNSLKNFLRKQGKLSSLCVNQGTSIC